MLNFADDFQNGQIECVALGRSGHTIGAKSGELVTSIQNFQKVTLNVQMCASLEIGERNCFYGWINCCSQGKSCSFFGVL